jgi:hypothetical protein
MKLLSNKQKAADNIPLFQVVTVHIGTQPEFYAKSLVNNWKGINRITEKQAELDGKMHAEALKFLFSRRLR